MMRPRGRKPGLVAAALALALAGCVTASDRNPYTVDELVAASVVGDYGLRFFPQRRPDLQNALGWAGPEPAVAPKPADGRFDVLALSSGGPDGAFGAGALKGLAAAGLRPQYEIVTGVSTGALMAPLVFTGQQNDPLLERLYTGGEMGRLLGRPNVIGALSGPALYSSAGIERFMERFVDMPLMRRVAAEHATGRRLLVATANLDANQLSVWNMGRIAGLGTPQALDLFRRVLRAAIAIPGALPPVPIVSEFGGRQVTELHGDAGVLSYFYAEPGLVPPAFRAAATRPGEAAPPPPRLDVILHNQIETQARPVEERSLTLAGVSVASLTRTSMRLLLDRTLDEAADAGVEMRYAFLPANWRTISSLEFDEAYMRKTFDLGYRQAMNGSLWKSGPR